MKTLNTVPVITLHVAGDVCFQKQKQMVGQACYICC